MKQEIIAQINIDLEKKIKYPELIDLGEQIGKSLKDQEQTGLIGISKLDCNYELIKQGLINGLLGEETQWNSDSAYEYFNQTLMSIQYGDSKKEGEDFLAENTKKEGVITTESGLQYEVIKMGDGKKPTANDNVKVHYHGTLIDGTVFDSSVERGEPIVFGLNQVISGWTEALQLMPVGSKFKLYIPSDLAYGAQQAGQIPPYSTLIFEVELLGIE
ncbi:MAG: FKBP-type peptidyl-prolyl cis-trans isomerase [Paludibacteraceae bacterium]|nr:FKBP-type peptidyl-prolyl cis-trans isomerase [Paludibacteraceae bacterium]